MPDDDQVKNEPAVTPVAPTQPTQPHISRTNGLAIASFVVGLVAFSSGWIPFWGLLVGAAAVVLGIFALKKPEGKGLSIAGIVTGGLGGLAGLAMTAFVVIAIVASGSYSDSNYSQTSQGTPGAQEMIDAKKDFAKGETAAFGQLDVTVNSVTRNYVPESNTEPLNDRTEYVIVNLTVKNVGEENKYVSRNTFMLNERGTTVNPARIDTSPEFINTSLAPQESVNGNLVYRVVKDATDLKIQRTERVTTDDNRRETLVYTLAI